MEVRCNKVIYNLFVGERHKAKTCNTCKHRRNTYTVDYIPRGRLVSRSYIRMTSSTWSTVSDTSHMSKVAAHMSILAEELFKILLCALWWKAADEDLFCLADLLV